MPRVQYNIIANALGRGWAMLMNLAFVPLYIRFLGIEAYGVIGFFATLMAVFSVLDLGLGATINRELARLSDLPGRAQAMRDLVRTLEVIYWGMAAIVGVCVISLAPFIAGHWLNAEHLSPAALRRSVVLMGLVMAVQWPTGFYAGGLNGLQHQVLTNVITAGVATLRSGGAVLILWLLSPTIEAYFQWQIVVSIIGVALSAFALWRYLPAGERPARFDFSRLHTVWRFAVGMTGISVVSLLLMQTDKLLLSTLLPLKDFGYYTLASSVGGACAFLIVPIFTAMFPHFSQAVATDDPVALAKLYHKASQLASVAVIPVVLTVAFFARDLLYVWTGDMETTENAWGIVSLLAIGTGLNGLMHMPYAMQLAHGWTSLTFRINTVAVLTLVPALFWIVPHYGGAGAATVWAALNASYIIIGITLMHRRILLAEKWRWYREDVLRPLIAALFAGLICSWLKPEGLGRIAIFVWLAGSGGVVLTATIAATPIIRREIIVRFAGRTSLAHAR